MKLSSTKGENHLETSAGLSQFSPGDSQFMIGCKPFVTLPLRVARLSICFVILMLASSAFAQNKYNFPQFVHETGDLAVRPGKWRGNDWLKIGAIGAGTLLVLQADQSIRSAVLRDQRYYHSLPIEAGRIWGEWYTTFALGVGFGSHGLLANNRSTLKIGYELVQADLYSQAVIAMMKVPFGRARPYLNKGAHVFRPFKFQWTKFGSFPGGHASSAFAISTVLSRNSHSDVVKVLCYVPAVLSATSRVYQDKHWTSDCFLGAIIGYSVGSWIVNLHERKESSATDSPVLPLAVSYRFY
jgi:membrane-associated phospholipid phosphatase